jgi:membrane associated rhomboid family serine protease
VIPFRDNIRSRTFPYVTIALIVLNVIAYLYELSLGGKLDGLLWQFGIVPRHVSEWTSSDGHIAGLALPFLTSMFLHGGFMHLLGNMWYLWIFGDNVEDRLGHGKYIVFYLICGLAAGLTHTLLNPDSNIPSVGASGAIAGVLGAYLVSYPWARVSTLVPILFYMQIIEIPALIVLGFWFLMQLFSASGGGGGVAWWAHIGGFLAGILFLFAMVSKPRQPYGYDQS